MQLLTANQNVDRIDLNQTHTTEYTTEMPTIDSAGRARFTETLRGERDPPRLRQR